MEVRVRGRILVMLNRVYLLQRVSLSYHPQQILERLSALLIKNYKKNDRRDCVLGETINGLLGIGVKKSNSV